MEDNHMSIIDQIKVRTAWALAHDIGAASPDLRDSPGAKFLTRVRDDVIERHEGDELDEDSLHEIADSAIPVYTHERWLVFVDLAAYQEDITELGEPQEDMTANAATALYLIASRLSSSLYEEITAASDDESEGDGDDVEGEED